MNLRELCQLELGWDEPIPEQLAIRWSNWISNLICLSELKVDRYFSEFEDADQIELHIFCDASEEGYGVVEYLRQSVQRAHFHKEIDHLQRNKIIDKNLLTGLNPVVFEGVLRMGGRLDKDYHERVGHVGMSHTWATIRQRFWIVKGAATVRNVLGHCLLCERRNARAGQQIMSDLPNFKVNTPPFYVTGVDYFGPMYVKQGRAMVKRWGCLFTCMTVRVVCIELVSSLSADSQCSGKKKSFANRFNKMNFHELLRTVS